MRPAAACCAALGLAVLVIPFVRQEIALSSLEQEIAVGRTALAEADSLRREIDRLSGSADFVEHERDKVGRPLAILAAATRILPDDTNVQYADPGILLYTHRNTLMAQPFDIGRMQLAGEPIAVGFHAADARLIEVQ